LIKKNTNMMQHKNTHSGAYWNLTCGVPSTELLYTNLAGAAADKEDSPLFALEAAPPLDEEEEEEEEEEDETAA
jgi:hypothetical protein